jgi:hypothetical protein
MAFAFTRLFWKLLLLAVRDVIPTLTVIGTLGPLAAAVIVTAQKSGRAGLRSLLSRVMCVSRVMCAVIGLDVDYEFIQIGQEGSILMVSASGTEVKL